jgi:murein tripeptide amidase MpaA
MPKIRFNKFHRYNELTRLLKQYAKEFPDLIRLESIGKSHEGRDVWLITATNFKSGVMRRSRLSGWMETSTRPRSLPLQPRCI